MLGYIVLIYALAVTTTVVVSLIAGAMSEKPLKCMGVVSAAIGTYGLLVVAIGKWLGVI